MLILSALFILQVPAVLAQRIGDVHGHTMRDATYQQSSPLDRLRMLSQWVGERRTSEEAVRLLVRREADAYLRGQPAVSSTTFGGGVVPSTTPRGTYGGSRGSLNQGLTPPIGIGRPPVASAGAASTVQSQYGGRLNAWYTLTTMAVRGGALQNIEIPSDLMDEVAMRMVFDDPRWSGAGPKERLALLEEVRRAKLWSPMLDHLAQGAVAEVMYRDTAGMSPDRAAIARMMLLRTYRQKEVLQWGPFLQATEERLLLDYLDSAAARQGGPKAKLVHLRRLEAEQMISSMTRGKFEIPYALEYLQQNQAFLASSPEGKRQIIRQLRDERMVDFLSVSTLELAFGAR